MSIRGGFAEPKTGSKKPNRKKLKLNIKNRTEPILSLEIWEEKIVSHTYKMSYSLP